jgi:salicylate hydroxylase
MHRLIVAGGGIGGLATALAAHRAHWQVRVLEQSGSFSEVGAGLQLGPNATRRLRDWGLLDAARDRGCAPDRLVARDALRGHALAERPLGPQAEACYGAPYLTLHRADLHGLLLQALQDTGVTLEAGVRVDAGLASLVEADGGADALVGADGLWSAVRESLCADGPPQPSDHVAYRGLIALPGVDGPWTREVTAWLGPRLHAVTYPVQGGRALNLVCVVQQTPTAGAASVRGWDLPDTRERLEMATRAIESAGGPLLELLKAVPSWGQWVLHDRPAVSGPHQLARGRVALVGDAAHPMRPYLAQGAAMALEDADQIGHCLRAVSERQVAVPLALQQYAQARWARVARVQRRSARNGRIFHAQGLTRLARDLALRGLGGSLMDLPWLYSG